MARFFFRLERVLSVRRHQEEREKLLFAAAARRLELAKAQLAEIEARLGDALGQPSLEQTTSLDELVLDYEYRLALAHQKALALENIARSATELDRARDVLIEARKRRRVLEQLRERHWDAWRAAEENLEQNELDEIGLQTFRRAERESADPR